MTPTVSPALTPSILPTVALPVATHVPTVTPVRHRRPQSTRRRPEADLQTGRVQARELQACAHGDAAGEVMASYVDHDMLRREIVCLQGPAGSVLVVDRDSITLSDRRLVAHLAPDEPPVNARIVCDLYMEDPRARWCRAVGAQDLEVAPEGEVEALARGIHDRELPARADDLLMGIHGERFSLRACAREMSIPELRWVKLMPGEQVGQRVSVRDVVAGTESYEPARALTASAVVGRHGDPRISVAVLLSELERLNSSRIVLNRGLREAVLSAVAAGGASMSEIALRCGRAKRDRRGISSGETTWLGRRLGLVNEGAAPTPWVHSEVLALVARSGLGVSPREVELA